MVELLSMKMIYENQVNDGFCSSSLLSYRMVLIVSSILDHITVIIPPNQIQGSVSVYRLPKIGKLQNRKNHQNPTFNGRKITYNYPLYIQVGTVVQLLISNTAELPLNE